MSKATYPPYLQFLSRNVLEVSALEALKAFPMTGDRVARIRQDHAAEVDKLC